MVVTMLVGGIAQGASANNPDNWDGSFINTVMVSRSYLVGRSLAWGFLILGNVVFFGHVCLMLLRLGRRSTESTLFGEVPAELKDAEDVIEPATAEAAKA